MNTVNNSGSRISQARGADPQGRGASQLFLAISSKKTYMRLKEIAHRVGAQPDRSVNGKWVLVRWRLVMAHIWPLVMDHSSISRYAFLTDLSDLRWISTPADGGYPLPSRGYPHPSRWGVVPLSFLTGGYLHPRSEVGRYPHPRSEAGRYPHPRSRPGWGVPHLRSGWLVPLGIPCPGQVPGQDMGGGGATPNWNSTACTCYAVDGMPLAFIGGPSC